MWSNRGYIQSIGIILVNHIKIDFNWIKFDQTWVPIG